MEFQQPLIRATLIKRYKRFLADVTLDDGREVTAHCANPGAMTGLNIAGMTVWLEPNDDPKRKLRYSWKLVEVGTGLVGIDTAMPNKIVAEALANSQIPELAAYKNIKPEVKYGENSRIDFLLTSSGLPDCYLEVKCANLSRTAGLVEFPDTVTKRGTKHLRELGNMTGQGHRAVTLYLVFRDDCSRFSVAADIDPTYATAFSDAHARGVETLCYATNIAVNAVTLGRPLPIEQP
ncbi:MAG: DNA/RNA nuclease SfsA [Rhodobacteraceae bacterium]|nr:DNA/RNA nuclease SfsA [Paracoccaceae bacterium]